ncbi:Tir chaperone family protein [Bordetella genomosp. 1]|uniref:Tir chaperone family protein n=1 Tax=Bordetella genomosp. 1 TaxID=1395607 RepID=A0A261S6Y6_9BORD|nr:type III secretion system chaperone [Bordetella genomosp. 1]MDQ8030957.1 type III secretion system chaperone [Bordetella sp.]OZI33096.1 Tir chaperone family protein [Bordetella genomosp. 1]OZI57202.1 hypothetical protein CAL27_23470 [Bordetella genomosp. 1]
MPDPTLARIVSEFGASLGMDGLQPSSEGVCQLVFDGRHVLRLIGMGARGQLLLSCLLAGERAETVQAELMAKANFMQAGRGVVFSVGPDGRAHAQLALPYIECTPALVLQSVEALLDQADRWNERVAREAVPAPRMPAPMFFQSV